MSPVLLLLSALLSCTSFRQRDVPPGARRHAIVIVLDTLRADALPYARTPNFDAFAADAQVVKRAWAAGTWTAPSVISLLSGTHVRQHGWDFPFPTYMDQRVESYPPVPDLPLLAEVLAEAGFETTGLYGNPLLGHDLGYDRGFDTWEFVKDRRLARRVSDEVGTWREGESHFLYLHMFGAHQPLRPSTIARARYLINPQYLSKGQGFRSQVARREGGLAVTHYQNAYLAVLEDLDGYLGEILEALADVREDAIVIITSDHGELLGEHGRIGHNRWVYEPLTHVPFMAQGAPELPETLSLTGLPAVVTGAVGVDHDWPGSAEDHKLLVAQREGKLALSPDGTVKGIWDEEGVQGGFALFDVEQDPTEEQPLEASAAAVLDARAEWEARTPASRLEKVQGGMKDDLVDALEELGYLDE